MTAGPVGCEAAARTDGVEPDVQCHLVDPEAQLEAPVQPEGMCTLLLCFPTQFVTL